MTPKRSDCAPLAGKSTLNRLELSQPEPDRYKRISADTQAIEALTVDLFLQKPPKQIIPDLDATDDPLHGEQEGRFFHGYYDCYCYLPLYIFCGRQLLAAKLRGANIDASAGAVQEPGLAADPHSTACRQRLRARGADGVVRSHQSGLPVRRGS